MKSLLYVFLASLVMPIINDNLWTLSGANFWVNYGIIFLIAFIGLSIFFVRFPKKDRHNYNTGI